MHRSRTSNGTVSLKSVAAIFRKTAAFGGLLLCCSCASLPTARELGVQTAPYRPPSPAEPGFRLIADYDIAFGQNFGPTEFYPQSRGFHARQARIDPDFERLATQYHVSVIRTHVFADGRGFCFRPDKFDNGLRNATAMGYFRRDMQALIRAARSRNLKVILVLADHSMAGPRKIVNNAPLFGRGDFITDERQRRWFVENIVQPIAHWCATDSLGSTVIGYDLLRHADCLVSVTEGGAWEHTHGETRAAEPIDLAVVDRFLSDSADAILEVYADANRPPPLVKATVVSSFLYALTDASRDDLTFPNRMSALSIDYHGLPSQLEWDIADLIERIHLPWFLYQARPQGRSPDSVGASEWAGYVHAAQRAGAAGARLCAIESGSARPSPSGVLHNLSRFRRAPQPRKKGGL